MNTIPSTFDRGSIPYTVIGERPADSGGGGELLPVAALVLGRPGFLPRRELIAELERLRVSQILWVGTPQTQSDIEGLLSQHPRLRFILYRGDATPGELVNIGIWESEQEFTFVLWSDMETDFLPFSPQSVEALRARRTVCVTGPVLSPREDASGSEGARLRDRLPSVALPLRDGRGAFRVARLDEAEEGAENLFPPDYCALYDRGRFILSGGYDPGIKSPWWQKLDFGMRVELLGEHIVHDPALSLSYLTVPPADDQSVNEDYSRFYLKNLAPSRSGSVLVMRFAAFLRWFPVSGLGLFSALSAWREAKRWLMKNRMRFAHDAASLIELWGIREP